MHNELVRRAQQGDGEAFGVLVQNFVARLNRTFTDMILAFRSIAMAEWASDDTIRELSDRAAGRPGRSRP
jgi:hypothetical protein